MDGYLRCLGLRGTRRDVAPSSALLTSQKLLDLPNGAIWPHGTQPKAYFLLDPRMTMTCLVLILIEQGTAEKGCLRTFPDLGDLGREIYIQLSELVIRRINSSAWEKGKEGRNRAGGEMRDSSVAFHEVDSHIPWTCD